MPDDKAPDRDEAVKRIIADYERKERVSSEAAKEVRERTARHGRGSAVLLTVGGIAALALALVFVFNLAGEAGFFLQKRYWAAGATRADGHKLNECVGELWSVRAAADAYYARYKLFPRTIEELLEAGIMKKAPVCPASGASYVVRQVRGVPVVACPNPEAHGVDAVWCSMRGGPPVVEKER